MKSNLRATPVLPSSLKRKSSSTLESNLPFTEAPRALYYPSKSEYEPVHESIPVYYVLPVEPAPQAYCEKPVMYTFKEADTTPMPDKTLKPEPPIIRK